MKQIQIIGYLGKDAEIIENNKKFRLQLQVAVTEKYENQNKETVENTDWFMCFKTYGQHPEKLMQYLKKGTQIFASGKPNFTINNTSTGIYKSLTINCNMINIVGFVENKEEEEEETKEEVKLKTNKK